MTGTDPVSAAAGQHAVIELRGVSKHYGTGSGQPVAAADDVSFAIEHGGLIALSGASGSGKSTVLHLIGAIERPDCGTIVNDGTEVTAVAWSNSSAAIGWAACRVRRTGLSGHRGTRRPPGS